MTVKAALLTNLNLGSRRTQKKEPERECTLEMNSMPNAGTHAHSNYYQTPGMQTKRSCTTSMFWRALYNTIGNQSRRPCEMFTPAAFEDDLTTSKNEGSGSSKKTPESFVGVRH